MEREITLLHPFLAPIQHFLLLRGTSDHFSNVQEPTLSILNITETGECARCRVLQGRVQQPQEAIQYPMRIRRSLCEETSGAGALQCDLEGRQGGMDLGVFAASRTTF